MPLNFWHRVLVGAEIAQIVAACCAIFCALHLDAYLTLAFLGGFCALRAVVPFLHRAGHRSTLRFIRERHPVDWTGN